MAILGWSSPQANQSQRLSCRPEGERQSWKSNPLQYNEVVATAGRSTLHAYRGTHQRQQRANIEILRPASFNSTFGGFIDRDDTLI